MAMNRAMAFSKLFLWLWVVAFGIFLEAGHSVRSDLFCRSIFGHTHKFTRTKEQEKRVIQLLLVSIRLEILNGDVVFAQIDSLIFHTLVAEKFPTFFAFICSPAHYI